MRKIEKILLDAWLDCRPRRISNSEVYVDKANQLVWLKLFGNPIAVHSMVTKRTLFSLAGWNTPTTRSRINHILLNRLNCALTQRAFKPGIAHSWSHERQRYECTTHLDSCAWYELFTLGNNEYKVVRFVHNPQELSETKHALFVLEA